VPGGSDLDKFAANLKAARTRAGMSQMDLARESGLHLTMIARVELRQREPRLTTITKLARGLGVPTSDLMRGL
jgi:transcriptional regulator with XRE-family HTH domain